MSILSSVRARRFAKQRGEAVHTLIAFRLRREWFALPIETVQKVIPLELVYDDPLDTGIRLTRYQDREIVVIDIQSRLFGERPQTIASLDSQYLAIVRGEPDASIGIPLDSPPSLRRVPRSAFGPLPAVDRETGKINCLGATLIQLADHPPLFLLDTRQLWERRNDDSV
jgi:chemotaxis signal transduction protein